MMSVPLDVKLAKLLHLKCVLLVLFIDLDLHSVHVMMDIMKMVILVKNVEWNVLLVIMLIPVSFVLVTELNQKQVVLVQLCIIILVKLNVHLALMLVLNVI
jgi:hypothetical protein